MFGAKKALIQAIEKLNEEQCKALVSFILKYAEEQAGNKAKEAM
jgi:UDP-glucose 6-dehydrogenase